MKLFGLQAELNVFFFFHGTPLLLKEWLTNYDYLDLSIW